MASSGEPSSVRKADRDAAAVFFSSPQATAWNDLGMLLGVATEIAGPAVMGKRSADKA